MRLKILLLAAVVALGGGALYMLEGKQGTFVNGFCFPGKILVHCDRIRVGGSMFVFLDRDEFDKAVLQLTPLEKDWDRSLEYAPGYETAAMTARGFGLGLGS